ncbi:hypothetical protein [Leptospira licerasiae]|uniref:hypothetical protein n=1 Tax=Leptospira licerasiae TaxID=447106 RepID=UPI00108359FE|nr:hypothetical protein [Leptospira licerasiae]TGM88485.1 hypothetical protein EHR05_13460 [Leptospira licerasiae]
MSKLGGLNFPSNGKPVFQGDYQREHDDLESEILNRNSDIFNGEIISGGEVTAGENPNTVNISATIAYDQEGKRIISPVFTGLVISRPNADSFVVLHHKFETENSTYLDSTGYANTYRKNSFDVLFKESLETGDVPLFKIRSLVGTVTILEDLRSWRRISEEIVRNDSIANTKLGPDIKVGSLAELVGRFTGSLRSSVVSALNALASWMDTEETARQNGDAGLQSQINNLGSIFAPINHSHSGFAQVYKISYYGEGKNFDETDGIPNVDGTIVVYRISYGISFGQGYSIHGHGLGGINPIGGQLFGVAARVNGTWIATTG